MPSLFGGHRRLLFRSYLILVASLLAVALGLQYGYGYLQATRLQQTDSWLEATLALVTARLESAPAEEQERIALSMSETLGVGVRLLDKDDVAMAADVSLEPLVNDAGETYYLYAPASLDAIIYLGPVAIDEDPVWTRFVPVLFYLSIFFVVGLWLRPLLADIDTMTSAAQRFAADYRTPLATSGEITELKVLAQNLDDMSARLSGLIQAQKELIAALSHEMRTPLARIRFALAVADDDSGEHAAGRTAAINDDLQEIDELIATMLDFARLDHPDLEMHWQDVPVQPWLERACEKYRELDKALSLDVAAGLDTAPMDPRLMTLAVSNLVSNANRHAASAFRVSVQRTGDRYSVCVEDDGEGVPKADREAVFKAFTRLDDSRSRDTGGYGLGLAVVARIAALHGGRVDVADSQVLGGASFVIDWAAPPK